MNVDGRTIRQTILDTRFRGYDVGQVDELLEKSLPVEVEDEILKTILSFPGISSPHHLRTRRIGSYCAIEVHVRMDGSISLEEAHETATAVENKLKRQFGKGTLVSIHVEPVKKSNEATE